MILFYVKIRIEVFYMGDKSPKKREKKKPKSDKKIIVSASSITQPNKPQ